MTDESKGRSIGLNSAKIRSELMFTFQLCQRRLFRFCVLYLERRSACRKHGSVAMLAQVEIAEYKQPYLFMQFKPHHHQGARERGTIR